MPGFSEAGLKLVIPSHWNCRCAIPHLAILQWFLKTSVINYCKLDGLNQDKYILWNFLSAVSPKSSPDVSRSTFPLWVIEGNIFLSLQVSVGCQFSLACSHIILMASRTNRSLAHVSVYLLLYLCKCSLSLWNMWLHLGNICTIQNILLISESLIILRLFLLDNLLLRSSKD